MDEGEGGVVSRIAVSFQPLVVAMLTYGDTVLEFKIKVQYVTPADGLLPCNV